MWPTPISNSSREPSPVTSVPPTRTVPLSTFISPVIASMSSVWPFPSTPAIPTISPARISKRDSADALDVPFVEDVEIVHLEDRLPRGDRLLLDAEEDVAADHQPREPRLGGAGRRERVHCLSSAQDGDAIRDLEHLVQLVRDEDDRHALPLEGLEDREQLGRLLRREHGGRLVEDEDVCAPIQRLHDLDPLLLARP